MLFFYTRFLQQVTGRDTHKKVSKEIHHVSHHTQHAIALELWSPYRADGGGQIGYEDIIAKMKNIVMIATIFPFFFSCVMVYRFIKFRYENYFRTENW